MFSIHGSFLALREELTKRGWVEKVLHSFPYYNPHPYNCPCNPNGWPITLSFRNIHYNASDSLDDYGQSSRSM